MVETTDNGKLIREMEGQLRGLADYYHYYAGAADKVGGETLPADRDNFFVYTLREPLGVVAAITPWNSPVLLMSWKLAPALAAGCTVVVKPAEQAPASTLEFAALVEEAGFPPGVFNVVTGFGGEAGAPLVAHPGRRQGRVHGRDGDRQRRDEGRRRAPRAGDAGARRQVAEHRLRGRRPRRRRQRRRRRASSPPRARPAWRARGCFVQDSVHDEFVERLAARARAIRLGDPLDPETEMGPVAFEGHLEHVLGAIASAKAEGRAAGHRRRRGPTGPGFFVEPTIFGDVDNGMGIARDEVFGPVLAALRFADEDEAIALANETEFGLAAGVWTRDVQRAHRMARALRAGTVWINAYRAVGPMAPFGGFKASGMGRENGLQAIAEYTELKTVWIELTGATRDPFQLG